MRGKGRTTKDTKKIRKKVPMTTKLEGVDKALVGGPLAEELFLRLPKQCAYICIIIINDSLNRLNEL